MVVTQQLLDWDTVMVGGKFELLICARWILPLSIFL